MSNQVNVVRTKFTNIATGEETYGVRIYDEYGSEYSNIWEKNEIPDDDLDLLSKCKEYEIGTKDDGPLDYVIFSEKGVIVDGNYYEWQEIKWLF